jgi:predicted DNA-binding transcriptional regulator AlpA
MNETTEARSRIDYVRSRRETADILGISLRTLGRMESRRELPPRIRVSERIYGYRDSAINQFIASRTA